MGIKHKYKEGMFDQIDRVIYDLKNNNQNIEANEFDAFLKNYKEIIK